MRTADFNQIVNLVNNSDFGKRVEFDPHPMRGSKGGSRSPHPMQIKFKFLSITKNMPQPWQT